MDKIGLVTPEGLKVLNSLLAIFNNVSMHCICSRSGAYVQKMVSIFFNFFVMLAESLVQTQHTVMKLWFFTQDYHYR